MLGAILTIITGIIVPLYLSDSLRSRSEINKNSLYKFYLFSDKLINRFSENIINTISLNGLKKEGADSIKQKDIKEYSVNSEHAEFIHIHTKNIINKKAITIYLIITIIITFIIISIPIAFIINKLVTSEIILEAILGGLVVSIVLTFSYFFMKISSTRGFLHDLYSIRNQELIQIIVRPTFMNVLGNNHTGWNFSIDSNTCCAAKDTGLYKGVVIYQYGTENTEKWIIREPWFAEDYYLSWKKLNLISKELQKYISDITNQ